MTSSPALLQLFHCANSWKRTSHHERQPYCPVGHFHASKSRLTGSWHPDELFECEVEEEREVLQEAELSGQADSENDLGGSSETMYFIGLDVHKKSISYCVKVAAGG